MQPLVQDLEVLQVDLAWFESQVNFTLRTENANKIDMIWVLLKIWSHRRGPCFLCTVSTSLTTRFIQCKMACTIHKVCLSFYHRVSCLYQHIIVKIFWEVSCVIMMHLFIWIWTVNKWEVISKMVLTLNFI